MKVMVYILIFLSYLMFSDAYSETEEAPRNTQMSDVLRAFSDNTGLKVVVSNEVKGDVNYFGFNLDQVDYDLLLTILKLNGFTAFKKEKYVEVVPGHRARVYASEAVRENTVYSDDQYLVETIKLENLCAGSLMPVLMPLVLKHSFIASQYESNSIVMVDYYSNIKRIKKLVRKLDANSEKQKKCEVRSMPRGKAKAIT